jgi:hypothetical protein
MEMLGIEGEATGFKRAEFKAGSAPAPARKHFITPLLPPTALLGKSGCHASSAVRRKKALLLAWANGGGFQQKAFLRLKKCFFCPVQVDVKLRYDRTNYF